MTEPDDILVPLAYIRESARLSDRTIRRIMFTHGVQAVRHNGGKAVRLADIRKMFPIGPKET